MGTHTPIHGGGAGGGLSSPEENLKKRSQMVASDGICGKDIDL